MKRPKVLSLGGGLDSWAMLLDAEIRVELPDVVAFGTSCAVRRRDSIEP